MSCSDRWVASALDALSKWTKISENKTPIIDGYDSNVSAIPLLILYGAKLQHVA